jgi:hypothetical protein
MLASFDGWMTRLYKSSLRESLFEEAVNEALRASHVLTISVRFQAQVEETSALKSSPDCDQQPCNQKVRHEVRQSCDPNRPRVDISTYRCADEYSTNQREHPWGVCELS